MIIDPEYAEAFRYLYATLSIVVCTGFVATLIIRWDVLRLGEKILRAGLVLEHVVITYGAYTALKLDLAPTIVAPLLTASMAVIVLGFAVWVADMLLHGDAGPERLTDR